MISRINCWRVFWFMRLIILSYNNKLVKILSHVWWGWEKEPYQMHHKDNKLGHGVVMILVSLMMVGFGIGGIIFLTVTAALKAQFFLVFSPIFMTYSNHNPGCSGFSLSRLSAIFNSSWTEFSSLNPCWGEAYLMFSKSFFIQHVIQCVLLLRLWQ